MRRARTALCLIVLFFMGFFFLPVQALSAFWTSPPDDLDPQTTNDDWGPRFVVASGTVWAVWMGIDPIEGDEEAMFTRWTGASWEPGSLINPPNQTADRFPEIGVARDGTIWCVWAGGVPSSGEYIGLSSRWTGSSWSWPDTIWTAGGRYDEYALAPASSSDAWFARSGVVGSTYDAFIYHFENGAVQQFAFAQPIGNEHHPTIALASDGTPWAAWYHVPPSSPDQADLQFTRHINGSWNSPEDISQPLGISRSYIHISPDDTKWIICLGLDPVNGYRGQALWGVRWDGSAWGPPTRISEPVASNDTLQTWLSVSRNPSGYPRAVWARANIFSTRRIDPLTSAWNGSQWTQPELAGVLTDSAYIQHPDVAVAGDNAVWVTYMKRALPDPTWHIYSTHRVEEPTAISSLDLEAEQVEGGIEIAWYVPKHLGALEIRISRAKGTFPADQRVAPFGSEVVLVQAVGQEPGGKFFDRQPSAEQGDLSYWLEARVAAGGSSWAGPRVVKLTPPFSGALISSAPNPTDGTVTIRGRLGLTAETKVQIFDLSGRLIRTLHPVGTRNNSGFSVLWDGRVEGGGRASSGVYYVRLQAQGRPASGHLRIVLAR